ncbi:hypothetical protein [Mucilaginibacter sp. KACC 22063]|uniref:hypothetical protein n=1 Tax=Mucilaginibacter sp. KACC 22063 TaxID=3025666 RepID=UPI0023656D26|nr:hypothetical protein [Mucilaginibacter sp. KACC 22063]WDF56710.1 hypothetical protein PQ461_06545 [Mucilaginibacter sp. KACC 22063]
MTIAALLFIAKPFIGYNTIFHFRKSQPRLVLVKAFTKRKPEFLEESEREKAGLHYKLSNPPEKNNISIAFLLSLLFPFLFVVEQIRKNRIQSALVPVAPGNKTYLLTGKLTI